MEKKNGIIAKKYNGGNFNRKHPHTSVFYFPKAFQKSIYHFVEDGDSAFTLALFLPGGERAFPYFIRKKCQPCHVAGKGRRIKNANGRS